VIFIFPQHKATTILRVIQIDDIVIAADMLVKR
jgi:hypothetical protein